jgi:hypothetical protein
LNAIRPATTTKEERLKLNTLKEACPLLILELVKLAHLKAEQDPIYKDHVDPYPINGKQDLTP